MSALKKRGRWPRLVKIPKPKSGCEVGELHGSFLHGGDAVEEFADGVPAPLKRAARADSGREIPRLLHELLGVSCRHAKLAEIQGAILELDSREQQALWAWLDRVPLDLDRDTPELESELLRAGGG